MQAFNLDKKKPASRLFTQLIFLLTLTVSFSCSAEVAKITKIYAHNHTLYDNVLQQFVKNGQVDYRGLKQNHTSLNRYLFRLSRVKEPQFNSWTKDQQLTWLINLYNATTLQLIIDHYPITSIKKIGSFFKGPWDQPVVKLFGKTITLNQLEHQIIRKRYNEPRVHLALVCAAKGCPPLRNEAYTAAKLNAQLNDQAKKFLHNPFKFRIDRQARTVYISPIFKWYGGDFIGKYSPKYGFSGLNKTEQAVMNFCSKYLSATDRQLLIKGGYSIKFLNYDWSLNKSR